MPYQELTGYGVSSSGSWTTPANAAGAPDGNVATTTLTNTLTVTMTGAFAALPDNAILTEVWIGSVCTTSNAGTRVTVKLSAGDTTSVNLNPGIVGYVSLESKLSAGSFTPAILKGTLTMTVNRTAVSSAIYVDAVWVRVVYTTDPTYEVKGWASGVVSAGSWVNPTNAVGPSDNLSATTNGLTTITLAMAALTDLAADASVVQVIMGTRFSNSQTNTYNAKLNAGDAVNRTVRPTFAGTLRDWEWTLDQTLFTPALLRGGTLTLAFFQTSGTTSNNALDSVWLRAIALVPATSRSKRWSGSAWVDAPVKRWSGTAWVDTTVKRWDGSAWV